GPCGSPARRLRRCPGKRHGRRSLMSVYQGARYRTPPLPFGARPVVQRRVGRIPVRGRTRVRPVTMVLAGILVAFLLGLVYLTQTLQAGVANYQIDNLMIERRSLQ